MMLRRVIPVFKNVRSMSSGIMSVEQFEREFYSPNVTSYCYQQHPITFSIIDTNLHMGQDKPGVGYGPMHLINGKPFIDFIHDATHNFGWYFGHRITIDTGITKHTNNGKFPEIKNVNVIDETTSRIYIANQYTSDVSDLTINIMGDHSASIGTIPAGLFQNTLIWIDAHADINTPESSLTGHCHGMPLGITTGLSRDYLHKNNLFSWLPQKFPLAKIIYVGVRDLDPFEQEIIDKHNIMVIQEDSSHDEFDRFYNRIRNEFTHVSFDVDVLDPSYFPCTGTPVEGGVSPDFIKKLMYKINMESTLTRLDIAEYNPHVSPDRIDECNKMIVDIVLMPLLE
jgi:arginase